MFVYSHNGQSMRSIDPGMETPEEVVFKGYATEAELLAAFPGRAALLAAEARAQIQAALTDAIQNHLDAEARTRGYDGILSLCSYGSSAHERFGKEGKEGVKYRDSCWEYGYQVIDDVHAGKRVIPTAEELVKELPKMVWP